MTRRPPSRRSRPTRAPQAPSQRTAIRPGWRDTFESFGGFWTLGGVLAIVAIIAVMVVASRPQGAGSTEAFVPRPHSQPAGRVSGRPDAPVKIVEYGDYQCPFCRRFWSDTEETMQKEFIEPGVVSFEYRDFVIIGPESRNAAEGAACAADQGFFWQMHDILFLRQGQENAGVYTESNVKKYAREAAAADSSIKFDASAFDRCMDSHTHRQEIEKMADEARGFRMKSTPSFLINGQLAEGALTVEQLRSAVNNARGGAR